MKKYSEDKKLPIYAKNHVTADLINNYVIILINESVIKTKLIFYASKIFLRNLHICHKKF